MKLVFPGGEHPQVLLGEGINRIGSDPQSNIVINHPGVKPQHCQLHVTSTGVTLDVPPGASVSVNGRPVAGLIALRRGDAVAFDNVQARLASVDAVSSMSGVSVVSQRVGAPVASNDSAGVTAVRAVVPRYVLRTVSGAGFGRSYPLVGPAVVGRAPDCSLRLDESGISRMHARLMPTAEGVQLEDLGSTNGSFINGKRVLFGEVRPGDEVMFDTLRFRLAAATAHEPLLSDGDERAAERGGQWARRRGLLAFGAAAAMAALVVLVRAFA
jgi:pSer/pThr/pTyr-binding forkhead associated (FHA) protein